MSGGRTAQRPPWTSTGPTRLSSLPTEPLGPEQLLEVKSAVQQARNVPTQLWLDEHNVGSTVATIVEDPTTFTLFEFTGASASDLSAHALTGRTNPPAGDGWVQHAAVEQDSPEGEACAAELTDGDGEYVALQEVV
jgi:hypothetical protein